METDLRNADIGTAGRSLGFVVSLGLAGPGHDSLLLTKPYPSSESTTIFLFH